MSDMRKVTHQKHTEDQCLNPLVDPRGGVKDAPPLCPTTFIISFSCSSQQNSWQIISFWGKLRGWRPPSRLVNPGSTTERYPWQVMQRNFVAFICSVSTWNPCLLCKRSCKVKVINHHCQFPPSTRIVGYIMCNDQMCNTTIRPIDI